MSCFLIESLKCACDTWISVLSKFLTLLMDDTVNLFSPDCLENPPDKVEPLKDDLLITKKYAALTYSFNSVSDIFSLISKMFL